MNIKELEDKIGKLSIFGISDIDFSILKNPYQPQSIILNKNKRFYEIYFFDEHGEKDKLQVFESESEACNNFYNKVLDLCVTKELYIKYLRKDKSIRFVKTDDFFELKNFDVSEFSKKSFWILSHQVMTESEHDYISHVLRFKTYKYKPKIKEEGYQIIYDWNKIKLCFSKRDNIICIPQNVFYKEANRQVLISDSMRSKIVEDIKIAMFNSNVSIVPINNKKATDNSIIYLK